MPTTFGIGEVEVSKPRTPGLEPGVVSPESVDPAVAERLTGEPKRGRGRPKKDTAEAKPEVAKAATAEAAPVPLGFGYSYWLHDAREILTPYPAVLVQATVGDPGRYDGLRFLMGAPFVVPVRGAPIVDAPKAGCLTRSV